MEMRNDMFQCEIVDHLEQCFWHPLSYMMLLIIHVWFKEICNSYISQGKGTSCNKIYMTCIGGWQEIWSPRRKNINQGTGHIFLLYRTLLKQKKTKSVKTLHALFWVLFLTFVPWKPLVSSRPRVNCHLDHNVVLQAFMKLVSFSTIFNEHWVTINYRWETRDLFRQHMQGNTILLSRW